MTDGVTSADLAGLPPAQAIEEYDHQAIVDAYLADFTARWEALRAADPDLPAIDVLTLGSEPTVKKAEAAAGREVLLRARINDALRSNLLFYAQGTDQDHLVIFYDVLRMLGESDPALQSRTILAIQGRSPGGPEERYKAIARAADVRVADVAVYRVGRDPTIHVAIYATDNDGVADAALIAKVSAALHHPGVQLVNDTIVVGAAIFQTVDVAADVWLLPSTSITVLDELPGVLRKAWAAETGMGFDFEPEWAGARMSVSGVRKIKVTTPAVVAEPFQALTLGTITPTFKGRSY
ncbi:baseplate J/gp47 family protein [Xanthobacter sp. 126]|uniref:baseplate J/gp47 family protein n=1 Tax=Xanthobacter sp. 126 TaxID=1131814 RepID=UPI00045E6400|nr:baseplate J/gp47 family protein [Xanthobacter sp. 126]